MHGNGEELGVGAGWLGCNSGCTFYDDDMQLCASSLLHWQGGWHVTRTLLTPCTVSAAMSIPRGAGMGSHASRVVSPTCCLVLVLTCTLWSLMQKQQAHSGMRGWLCRITARCASAQASVTRTARLLHRACARRDIPEMLLSQQPWCCHSHAHILCCLLGSCVLHPAAAAATAAATVPAASDAVLRQPLLPPSKSRPLLAARARYTFG